MNPKSSLLGSIWRNYGYTEGQFIEQPAIQLLTKLCLLRPLQPSGRIEISNSE